MIHSKIFSKATWNALAKEKQQKTMHPHARQQSTIHTDGKQNRTQIPWLIIQKLKTGAKRL